MLQSWNLRYSFQSNLYRFHFSQLGSRIEKAKISEVLDFSSAVTLGRKLYTDIICEVILLMYVQLPDSVV